MNSKLVILGVLIACAVAVNSYKSNKYYGNKYYGGFHSGHGCGCEPSCECDDFCAPPCAPPCASPCASPCGPRFTPLCGHHHHPPACPPCGHCYGAPCGTITVSPVVGLLTKMKAKFIEKLTDDCDDYKYGKKCKWLHSPHLCKNFHYVNKYC